MGDPGQLQIDRSRVASITRYLNPAFKFLGRGGSGPRGSMVLSRAELWAPQALASGTLIRHHSRSEVSPWVRLLRAKMIFRLSPRLNYRSVCTWISHVPLLQKRRRHWSRWRRHARRPHNKSMGFDTQQRGRYTINFLSSCSA